MVATSLKGVVGVSRDKLPVKYCRSNTCFMAGKFEDLLGVP